MSDAPKTHTIQLRSGKSPAEQVSTAELEKVRAAIVGFAENYDVTPIVAPEKPATLSKGTTEAPEAKVEKSK